MREKELSIFLEALFALKNAAAYTAGDLYFALHEGRVRSALLAAEQSLAQKGRLCVALGLFVGVSAALILL